MFDEFIILPDYEDDDDEDDDDDIDEEGTNLVGAVRRSIELWDDDDEAVFASVFDVITLFIC